jgi:hypothetical protein
MSNPSFYKEIPSKRLCLIDYYPLFLKSLKEVQRFCLKQGVSIDRDDRANTAFITKLIYHFCLNEFLQNFKEVNSKYPKVIVYYPVPDSKYKGLTKVLNKIFNLLPISWCKVNSFNSPDVIIAAESALEKIKANKPLKYFAQKHQLYDIFDKIHKNSIFLKSSVDLPSDTE